jgi:hypothetical protein
MSGGSVEGLSMAVWEYAMFYDVNTGDDGVRFTRDQGPQLVTVAKQMLDRGLHERDSNGRYLHLNMRNTSEIVILGMLGEWGWELVSGTLTASTGSDRVWLFKRPAA